ncbi:MAG: PQQ-dependent sugar dehydrogenase [Pirellulales bacterium]
MTKLFHIALTCCVIGLLAMPAVAQKKKEEDPGPPIPKDPILNVQLKKSFTNLRIRRPIVVTHAGDGTDRLFLAEQQGVIRVIANDYDAEEAPVFLDMEKAVHFNPKKNEEGLLGFTFHPDYKNNGQFYVYYTSSEEANLSVISRFNVSKNDPNKADLASEEIVMLIPQPYWNHNGGTISFGPDGYLYISLGDGGLGNDPHGNGQKLSTLYGSILRIDVNKKDGSRNYAIPKDNPFVNRRFAQPEIYAYGVRNIWRHGFDRETGTLWAGEVGQGLWEEILIIEAGGNYGWSVREGKHAFERPDNRMADTNPVDPKVKMIEPIYEYHHNNGKSITGGYVYRGKKVPQLVGKYLYADYVTGKVWALDYDQKAGKVKANYRIPANENPPVITFGEDENGEVLMVAVFGEFGTIYRFESK